MATNFFRTYVDDRSFIRGAGRILTAPISQAFPSQIDNVIALASAAAANDVQTLSATGATAGDITLSPTDEDGNIVGTTTNLVYTSTASAVQAALVALPAIGAGNVTCSGGPLNTAPIVITFGGLLADSYQYPIVVTDVGLVGATAEIVHTTEGTPALNLYDAQPGWSDLGSTKNGITITINNGEDTFTIDQQLSIIASQPNSWSCTVGTSLAESTPERMQVAWEGSAITLDNTPASGPEQQIGFGAPNYYIQRRVAVLFQRPSGLIRGYFFRIAQRSPQESSLVHAPSGDQQSIPILLNILADNTVTDVLSQLFIIRDQAIPGLDGP
jgi:hypothetical protein